jgi:hypothetical protein
VPRRISIEDAQDVLTIIGEEDSIGLDKDQEVQDAISLIQGRIEQLIEQGHLHARDNLITYE